MKLFRATLAFVIVVLAVSVASAQTGGITVQVVDSNGPLPGATVTISHETGFVKTTAMLTDGQGIVEFPVLRPGRGYVIEVQFPGFGIRRVPDIRVQISQSTPITVQLAAEIQENVKVIAEGDVVDLEDTQSSTKFSDEFIQDLPVPGRFYQNVLTLAPGVQDADGDGNPNVHGSRARDFKAVVSGISNVDPLTGGFMSRVNPNSIEEMEVITAGAGVEFSRAQGGFARIIQKQGTNEFEGVFDFIIRSSTFDRDGAADFDKTSDPDFETIHPGFQFSGPIVKDKVWFVLSHELIDREDPINVVSGFEIQTFDQTINSDTITWQVSPRNKLALQFQSDPYELDNFGVTSLTPAESASRLERGGETLSLAWTAPFSPRVYIESRVAWQELEFGRFPSTKGVANSCLGEGTGGFDFLNSAQCFNGETGETTGSYPISNDSRSQRLTVRTDATLFGGRLWGMSHRFKMGFVSENERFFRDLEIGPRVQVFIFEEATDAEDGGDAEPERQAIVASNLAVFPDGNESRATSTNWGFYVEDQVKPRSNLTLTLGMRVDREEINANGRSAFNPSEEQANFVAVDSECGTNQACRQRGWQDTFTAYEGVEQVVEDLSILLNVSEDLIRGRLSSAAKAGAQATNRRRQDNVEINNTNFSPSLSVAWDPWSNNKTKFALTARRYYDKIFLEIPMNELNPANVSLVFNAETTANGFVPTTPRSSVNPAVNVDVVDRDLRTPYNDEFTISFEREVWAETSLKLTYVNRKFRDQLQDVNINRAPGDLGRCLKASLSNVATIEPSPGFGFFYPDPFNPGAELYDSVDGDGDGQGPSGFDDCAGKIIVPEGQIADGEDFLSRDKRLEVPDGIPDLYVQSPMWGNMYYLSNINETDYEAYVVELIRRQYRSWEMQASYTWSEAIGDGDDYRQQIGDDQSLVDNERGYQSYDQRHSVKVSATTITPWGFRIGGAASWQSGLPYSLMSRQTSFDQVPPQFQNLGSGNPPEFRFQYKKGQRNSERNVSYYNFDLKLTKEMNLGRGLNLQLSAEIFNLLNEGTYKIWDRGAEIGRQINGNNIAFREFGRRFQLSMKMAF